MDTIEELEILIEKLRSQLNNSINENRPKSEICQLSKKLDKLIVLHSKLSKK